MKPNILIVDDEKEARNNMRSFLSLRFNANYVEASDGDEAIKYLKKNKCDLMILDIKMPKKSGLTVIDQAIELDPKLKILMISGWVDDDVAQEALKRGATDYIPKPLSMQALEIKVRNILNKI